MKKTTALWTLTIVVSLASGATSAETSRSARSVNLIPAQLMQAPPQAAAAPAAKAAPAWKTRDEYDAFNAIVSAPDPDKKIALADAFIQKYPTSDFKYAAYQIEMQIYASQNKTDKAIDAGKKALALDPANLAALRFLSFTFPFLYKPEQPNSPTLSANDTAALTTADSNAHHGLDLMQKLQKPQGASDADFQTSVKDFRSVFNSCIGFVALQRKLYPDAITALKFATADNPNATYAYYWMSLAYYYGTPRDNDHAIWYGARAVSLAKAGKDPNADAWEKFLKQNYMSYHGTDTGLTDIETQTAANANPPDNFKIEQLKAPDHTGNAMVDNFNDLTFPLKEGGQTAQNTWDGVKGQPASLGGSVTEIVKGPDPDQYLVHIAILDSTKSGDGYDIELKDTKQPNVKNLQKGDLVTFTGTLDSYVATPAFVLTLVGTVTSELPDKPEVKKPPVHHTPVHRPTTPTN
jgi:tetratricopeptide (TPR) repeat protein